MNFLKKCIQSVNRDWLNKNNRKIYNMLDERTIDLGIFLDKGGMDICLKELTFVGGGSNVLDYAFIQKVAQTFNCKGYLEIGTYIGESINILTDYCDTLYSVTAPPESEFSMRDFCKENNMPDYTERLTYNDKIIHFFCDSKEFDFMKVAPKVDLYFIDGDHSYNGVFCDTKNVFAVKKENAIVIWHDFKIAGSKYNVYVVRAVYDALKKDFENVYVTNDNLCAIYIPEDLQKFFSIKKMCYEKNAVLHTYDVILTNHQKK